MIVILLVMVTYTVRLTYCVKVHAFNRTDAELKALESLERNVGKPVATEVKEVN